MTIRDNIVKEAEWCLANRTQFDYSEGGNRWAWRHNGCKFRITTDCSGTATMCYFRAKAVDPNGNNFNGGYTGTMIAHGNDSRPPEPADLVIYFDGPGFEPSTGSHVAVIVQVENGHILTISHGEQGNPTYCWVGSAPANDQRHFPVDTRKHKFYSWYPTQNELLQAEPHKPVSEPVRPVEAPKPVVVPNVSDVLESGSQNTLTSEMPTPAPTQPEETVDVPSVMGK